jgi:hypothetical protein
MGLALDLRKITDEQIKRIANLASDDYFCLEGAAISRESSCIKITEAKGMGLQQICLWISGSIMRIDLDKGRKTYNGRPICNVIELGKYLENDLPKMQEN